MPSNKKKKNSIVNAESTSDNHIIEESSVKAFKESGTIAVNAQVQGANEEIETQIRTLDVMEKIADRFEEQEKGKITAEITKLKARINKLARKNSVAKQDNENDKDDEDYCKLENEQHILENNNTNHGVVAGSLDTTTADQKTKIDPTSWVKKIESQQAPNKTASCVIS